MEAQVLGCRLVARLLQGLYSERPQPGRQRLPRASGHSRASSAPPPSEWGSRGVDHRSNSLTRSPGTGPSPGAEHQEVACGSERVGRSRGAGSTADRSRSDRELWYVDAAASAGPGQLGGRGAVLRRVSSASAPPPRRAGRGKVPASGAVRGAGAPVSRPPVRARVRHPAPNPRRRPAAPSGERVGRSRGAGSTADRSPLTKRPRAPGRGWHSSTMIARSRTRGEQEERLRSLEDSWDRAPHHPLVPRNSQLWKPQHFLEQLCWGHTTHTAAAS
ncbi:hypothetical protein NDU88_004030 [Pleurodeles waltl]|uniref:Uncharacterized protein n=1 Tax=Pleurodeles waltl TaxID=8319 RepID=A0AAV7UDX6_PLEWA|nr:hypothetical protein NDU88_004030 [Pleurodeles waltl]